MSQVRKSPNPRQKRSRMLVCENSTGFTSVTCRKSAPPIRFCKPSHQRLWDFVGGTSTSSNYGWMFADMPRSDYIGCNFFSFLYGIPLLKQHKASFVTPTCLRNTGAWTSISSIKNDCLLVGNPEKLFKLLKVVEELPSCELPLQSYLCLRSSEQGPHRFNTLVPRPTFNIWLYGFFFKLALPAVRDHDNFGGFTI